jgi:hypothetical protein
MTCIVGLVHGGKVYIGGDSAGSNASWGLTVRNDKKVFVNSGFAMGFTSSFRMGQLLAYTFIPPVPELDTDLMKFMVNTFIVAVRNCFKDGGYASKTNDVEAAGNFLVGYRGRLFEIGNDYQVGEASSGLDTVGCGAELALGSLYATAAMKPRSRILTALKIAEQCSAGVRAPFHIVTA